MDELLSRKAVIDAIYKNGCNTRRILDAVKALPSAQPKIKPIDYRDCANAMLKMWIWDVLTDGEYYGIMDKLNKHKHELERRNDG